MVVTYSGPVSRDPEREGCEVPLEAENALHLDLYASYSSIPMLKKNQVTHLRSRDVILRILYLIQFSN